MTYGRAHNLLPFALSLMVSLCNPFMFSLFDKKYHANLLFCPQVKYCIELNTMFSGHLTKSEEKRTFKTLISLALLW